MSAQKEEGEGTYLKKVSKGREAFVSSACRALDVARIRNASGGALKNYLSQSRRLEQRGLKKGAARPPVPNGMGGKGVIFSPLFQ